MKTALFEGFFEVCMSLSRTGPLITVNQYHLAKKEKKNQNQFRHRETNGHWNKTSYVDELFLNWKSYLNLGSIYRRVSGSQPFLYCGTLLSYFNFSRHTFHKKAYLLIIMLFTTWLLTFNTRVKKYLRGQNCILMKMHIMNYIIENIRK